MAPDGWAEPGLGETDTVPPQAVNTIAAPTSALTFNRDWELNLRLLLSPVEKIFSSLLRPLRPPG